MVIPVLGCCSSYCPDTPVVLRQPTRQCCARLKLDVIKCHHHALRRDINANFTIEIRAHAIEWHRKFFLALSCLLLFFIGAPLGAIIRKGGLGMPTVLAIGIFLAFYILSMIGEQMVKAGKVTPWFGMWMSSLALLPFAVYFTRQAMRDAQAFQFNWPRRFSRNRSTSSS